MSTSESNIQREIMIAASKGGMTVWRNNTGSAWQGKRLNVRGAEIRLSSGRSIYAGERDQLLAEARPIEFGLCPGSADLIGIRPLTIGPEHVGMTLGQFVAIEVKSKGGRATDKQKNFLNHIGQAGGFVRLARSTDDIKTR